jgi:hypothetical protein
LILSPGGVFGGEGMCPPEAGDAGGTAEAGDRAGLGEGEGLGDGEALLGEEWIPTAAAPDVAPSPAAAWCSASLPLRVSTCTTSDFGRENDEVRLDGTMFNRRGCDMMAARREWGEGSYGYESRGGTERE